ncbi:MAG: hypothetical protein K2X47_03570 [Bdellovibrionales bacterium]|nr:hypothetical protein [Bdellovibrionales bacterium]
MKSAILCTFIMGIFYATHLQAQMEASAELIDEASKSGLGILQREQPSTNPIVCSEGKWNNSLGCCARPSGICVTESYDVDDEE